MNPLSHADLLEREIFGDARLEWTEYREPSDEPENSDHRHHAAA